MKIVFVDDLNVDPQFWSDLRPGHIYQSVQDPSLLALRSKCGKAYCIRDGSGVKINDIWEPGPGSKWHKVESKLHIGVSPL